MAKFNPNHRPHNFKDLTGQTFGRLTVIEYHGRTHAKRLVWRCECSCGKECCVIGEQLTTGRTRSCGCLNSELTAARNRSNATHGMTRSPEYNSWRGIVDRCCNSQSRDYKHWGAKGVGICDEWRNSFEAFLAYVGPRPSPRHSIDRFPDNNGNYEPGNVRWATPVEQIRNRRNARVFEFRGKRMTIQEIADAVGVSYKLIHDRIFQLGWSIERAATQRAREYRRT
jgi:hypothetical protein